MSLLKCIPEQRLFCLIGIEETVKLVRAAGGSCYGYVCDLCDREDVYKKAKIIKEEIGKVKSYIILML